MPRVDLVLESNVERTARVVQMSGIFDVRVHGVAEAPIEGVASLGVRPTIADSGRILLEVHLFDFARNLYGKRLRVEFLHKLRDEEKYDDVATLTAAIAADASAARAWFERDDASPHKSFAISATDRII